MFGSNIDKEELRKAFNLGISNGLNLWDTAYAYGMGESEKILGEFVKDIGRDSVVLSTKLTPQCIGYDGDSAMETLDNSLKRLNTDYIDIYWVHNSADVEKWTPELIPLLKSGKVKNVGVSNYNLSQIKRANEILTEAGYKLSAVQNHFSLIHRDSEEEGILDYCKENNITFFAYMVLEQGSLTGKYDKKHPFKDGTDRASAYNDKLEELESLIHKMKEIGNKYGVSAAEIATAWAINKGTLPIIGVTKMKHVEGAIKSKDIVLSNKEMQDLEDYANKINIKTIRTWERISK